MKETRLLPKLTNPPQVTVEAAVEHLKAAGNFVTVKTVPNTTFGDIAYDSRKVTTDSAFLCLPGEKTDGNRFIKDALDLGASLIVSESQLDNQNQDQSQIQSHIRAQIQVKDARAALAELADLLFDHPSRKLRLLGVTGTNGKTTTTHLVEHIFAHLGKTIGIIGTLGARTNNIAGADKRAGYIDMKHTTPQASDLQRLLFNMLNEGVAHVAMEVSSHALALKRVAQCDFAAICLTNLTQDHLDFHKDMENYFASKKILFEMLNLSSQTGRTAVVNRDDPWAQRFIDTLNKEVKLITYGWTPESDLFVKSAKFDFSGTDLALDGIYGVVNLKLRLNGKFNVYNVMAALALSLSEGVTLEECVQALEVFDGVSGRFESVGLEAAAGRQPLCLVDYAHTPDGLENVLKSARALVPPDGKLIAVFGCGGDRDATKRPQMGKIAEALADLVIVTSDNPRSEDPDLIIENILTGINERKSVLVDVDRTRAIHLAVASANDNDIIVVAGKGHETYQILRDKTIDFDDRLVVKSALTQRLSR